MTIKKPKNKNNSVTPMSVQEFKMWIKGLSDFQDDGWAPNKTQWEHIRLLIDSLNDTVNVASGRKTGSENLHQVRQPAAPMGEAAMLEDNISNPPAQPRFLQSSKQSVSTGERDEFGHAILKSVYEAGSEFA